MSRRRHVARERQRAAVERRRSGMVHQFRAFRLLLCLYITNSYIYGIMFECALHVRSSVRIFILWSPGHRAPSLGSRVSSLVQLSAASSSTRSRCAQAVEPRSEPPAPRWLAVVRLSYKTMIAALSTRRTDRIYRLSDGILLPWITVSRYMIQHPGAQQVEVPEV